MLNGATTPSSDDPNSADSCPSPSPASQTVSVRAMIGDAPAPTPYPTCAVLPATAVGSSLTLWLQVSAPGRIHSFFVCLFTFRYDAA